MRVFLVTALFTTVLAQADVRTYFRPPAVVSEVGTIPPSAASTQTTGTIPPSTASTQTTGPTYIIAVSKCITPGLMADVSVDLLNRANPVAIMSELYDKRTGEVYGTSRATINPEHPQVISIPVPKDLNLVPFNNYYIRVTGVGTGVNFTDEAAVSVRTRNVSGFVQTDKAVYKPGDTVQYRIFSLFPDLKVNKAAYKVEIRDPKRNKIRYDRNVTDPTGLIRGSLSLSDEPLPGLWVIDVTLEGTSTRFRKQFEVKEYVLPRIEVIVKPPTFITESQSTLDVEITGKYTFGDAVRGRLHVQMSYQHDQRWWWNRSRRPSVPSETMTIEDFVGQTTISIPIRLSSSPYPSAYRTPINVRAELTETLTGNVATGTGTVRIYTVAEKMAFLPTSPRSFIPGLTYKAFIKISQQDGSPVAGSLEDFRVVAEFTHQVTHKAEATLSVTPSLPQDSLGEFAFQRTPTRCSTEDVTQLRVSLKVLPGGVLEITIPTVPENGRGLSLRATYRGISAYHSANPADSPSDNFLQIGLSSEYPKPGESHSLQVKSTMDIDSVGLIISARGRVVMAREETRPSKSKELNIPVEITHDMAPRAKVVAYYTTASGEIVADTITFNVKDPFETKVSVGFSAEEVEPGDDVTMTVLTAPNSLVATSVVDKKVLLLKTGNDISEKQVVSDLWQFECNYYGGRLGASAIFFAAGLSVLTDSILTDSIPPKTPATPTRCSTNVCAPFSLPRRRTTTRTTPFGSRTGGSRGGAVSIPRKSAGNYLPDDEPVPLEEIRKDFPDTWLFMVEIADSNGEVNIPTTAPDSITTWQATAFAFNDQTGFGITTEPGKLLVAKSFFANLVLPFSVIRGEELFLQVNVFNNLRTNQTVVVELHGSSGYLSLDIDDDGNEVSFPTARTQTLRVPSGIPKSVIFPIRTVEVGDIPVTVLALSGQSEDSLTKTLKVEPEGVPGEYNFIVLVNLTESRSYNTTREISYPPRVVEDSQKLGVKLVGDVLGGTLANLANLVRMSYGCGEQNMVNFAPTVFVSRYLEKVDQLTGQRRDNAISFISSGYQRQLNYRRRDGSYSAFGDRDRSGNLWLTAFVVKSFSAAASQDLLSLDSGVLDPSYRFIRAHQNLQGQFQNVGTLHHKRLQGESGRGDALTAYVLAALLENPLTTVNLSEPIERAQRYVEGYVQNTTDVYELAIGAYALALAGSSQVDSVLSQLESRATTKDGYTFWTVEAEPIYKWGPPKRRSQAASIETTSYVCLVYALRRDLDKSGQCLSYLVSQQNDQGGFVSTQDTVVAIQALSALAPLSYSPVLSGSFVVEAGGLTASFSVNDANRYVLQQATLPVTADDVTVRGSGSGVFLMSISVRYNIESDLMEPAFSVTANLTRDTPGAIDLSVCVRYLRGVASNMANIEIRLPSGFTLTAESKEDLLTAVKRVETLDGKVLLYLDEITNRQMCLRLTATGNEVINKPKPNSVRVFDYYNPDASALTFYKMRSLDGDFCEAAICTRDPEGCSANCSKRRKK